MSLCGMAFARLAISKCYGCLCVVWCLSLSAFLSNVREEETTHLLSFFGENNFYCYHSLEKQLRRAGKFDLVHP